MPKPQAVNRKCQKCEEPATEGQSLCKEHFAEYMRDYRSRSDRKRDKANGFRGFEEGVSAAIDYMEKKIAGRSVSGFEAARLLKRDVTGLETGDQAARRKLLDMLRAPFQKVPFSGQ